MTDADRLARSHRAETAWREFIEPMIDELKNVYSQRIVEIATTELHPTNRSDKITALSNALKILDNLEGGMLATIRDGELAGREMLRAEKIERMSDAQQRLIRITG